MNLSQKVGGSRCSVRERSARLHRAIRDRCSPPIGGGWRAGEGSAVGGDHECRAWRRIGIAADGRAAAPPPECAGVERGGQRRPFGIDLGQPAQRKLPSPNWTLRMPNSGSLSGSRRRYARGASSVAIQVRWRRRAVSCGPISSVRPWNALRAQGPKAEQERSSLLVLQHVPQGDQQVWNTRLDDAPDSVVVCAEITDHRPPTTFPVSQSTPNAALLMGSFTASTRRVRAENSHD